MGIKIAKDRAKLWNNTAQRRKVAFRRFQGTFGHEKLVHFGVPFGTKIGKGCAKLQKNTAQYSKQGTVRCPRVPQVGHCMAQTVNTICFARSDHVHLDGFGVALGCHLESLLETLANQSPNLSVKWGAQKAFPKKR